MTRTRLTIAILVLGCATALSAPARAESLVVRNCNWCHGSSAQGYSPAPRLAGQRAAYIENQLMSFRGHLRDNPFSRQYMWGAAANVSPQTARDLSTYFAMLPGKAANDGDRDLVAMGETVYQQGMPDENIVACVACHGPRAEGTGTIPRLGGLSYAYLKRRLEQWGQGYHAAAGPPMPSIAAKLPPDLTAALASYLSFVK
jgi:cytochrome c553